MNNRLAVQIYSLRQEMKDDFVGTMHRLAEIGYTAVETAGLPDTVSATAAGKLFGDLELQVCSAHLPLPLGENKARVIDIAGSFACQRIVTPNLTAADYAGKDRILATCDLLNEAHVVAQENDLELGIHNHWWEYQPVDGLYPYEVCLEYLEPGIFFELDTYWIQSAGLDPAKIVRAFADRAPLLHIKDGPAGANTDAAMTALGQGNVDSSSILSASAGRAEWLIVELDRCDSDMMEAVNQSYHYLQELV